MRRRWKRRTRDWREARRPATAPPERPPPGSGMRPIITNHYADTAALYPANPGGDVPTR